MALGYWQVAEDLRAAILRGDYPPGSALPKITELQQRYGLAKATIQQAITVLEHEGLVEAIRRRGTIVRERPRRQRIARTREVYRDERGYYFDPAAQTWHAVQPPRVSWEPAPEDIARLLGVAAGSEVLIRDRVMGEEGKPMQLATSYLPADLSRGTVLASADTGPGGIYDRLEEMGHGPLRWAESVSARMPIASEARLLGLPPGVPLLRITRATSTPAGRIVEVNDTRMSGEAFEIRYTIQRHPSAQPAQSEP